MQLGQVFGLFFLPGGHPRLLRVSGSSTGLDLGMMTLSGVDSVSDSVGAEAAMGTSGSSTGKGGEGSRRSLPSGMTGVLGKSSHSEVAGNVIGQGSATFLAERAMITTYFYM